MAQISIEEAAVRSGAPRQTLEEWAECGLLTLQVRPRAPGLPAGSLPDKCVDEDELVRVVESLGWLHLSASGWDGAEEE